MFSLASRYSKLHFGGLIVIVILLGIIMLVRAPLAQAQSSTGIAYSNDPQTAHHATWNSNVVISFDGPGTTFTVYRNGSSIGSLHLPSSPAQVGGFNGNFEGGNNGDVFSVTPGGASCTLIVAYGHRYCGIAIPDNDGDGVPNAVDTCPNDGSVGFGIYANGCPIYDGDGDGIPDNLDACPTDGSVGFGVHANGCPIYDGDGDGVPDNVDACPSMSGTAANNGCPMHITTPPPTPTPVPSHENRGGGDGEGITPQPTPTITHTPTLVYTRTPDPSAPCNIVVKDGTQGVNIRSSPLIALTNIVSNIRALEDPRTVLGWEITDNGNWWVLEDGYVYSGVVNFGGMGCPDIIEGRNNNRPQTMPLAISAEVLAPIMNDCSNQLRYVLEELPVDVQYLVVEHPEIACNILRSNQYFGAEIEDQIGSETLSTLLSECPVETAQYTALLQQLYQVNPASAEGVANSLNNSSDICAAIGSFIERFGLNQGNSDDLGVRNTNDPYVIILRCLPNITPTRARVIATAIGRDISSLGENPCAVVERYNLIQTIPDDQRSIYEHLINECGLSQIDALNYILLFAAGFEFYGHESCSLIPDIEPVIPSDAPEHIRQCDATMVNLFMWVRANRAAITPSLSITEEGFILSASDPCAAVYLYLSRGLIDFPSMPVNTPTPTEPASGQAAPPIIATPMSTVEFVSITIGSPESIPLAPVVTLAPTTESEDLDVAASLVSLFVQNSTSALVTVRDGERQLTYEFVDATSLPYRVYDELSASQINLSIGSGGWGAYTEAKDGEQTLWFQQTLRALNPGRARYPIEFIGFQPVENARIAWHPNERSLFVPLQDSSTNNTGIYFIRLINFNTPDRSQVPFIPDATDPFVIGSYLVYRNIDDHQFYFMRISDLMSNPGLSNAGMPIQTISQNTTCESIDAVYRGENATLENDIVLICGNMLYVGNVDNADNTVSIDLTGNQLSGQASDVSLVPGLQNIFTFDDGTLAFSINIMDGHFQVLGFAVDGKPITRLEWTQFINQ